MIFHYQNQTVLNYSVTTELKQPLSLLKKFDSDNSFLSCCRTFSTDFMDCTNVKLSVVGEGGGGVVPHHWRTFPTVTISN